MAGVALPIDTIFGPAEAEPRSGSLMIVGKDEQVKARTGSNRQRILDSPPEWQLRPEVSTHDNEQLAGISTRGNERELWPEVSTRDNERDVVLGL